MQLYANESRVVLFSVEQGNDREYREYRHWWLTSLNTTQMISDKESRLRPRLLYRTLQAANHGSALRVVIINKAKHSGAPCRIRCKF